MTSSSLIRDNCLLGKIFPADLRHSKNLILLSTINFSDMSNICIKMKDLSLYFWRNANCLNNSFPWIQMLPLSKKHSADHRKNQCLALMLLVNASASFAIDHSPSSSMIVILREGSILRRCQSPYHHRWQNCHLRVSPYFFQHFYRFPHLRHL